MQLIILILYINNIRMVKNTQGGNRHKKFARKNNDNGNAKNRLRISEDECELYAIVTKTLGNGMFHCHCLDDTVRLGHIRGKFSGKGKRDNFVEGGKWVLVGLREWDTPTDKDKTTTATPKKTKMQQCDLLEVYTDTDKLRLRESVLINWNNLDNNDVTKEVSSSKKDINDPFIFATDTEIEREKLMEKMKTNAVETITLTLGEKNDTAVESEEEINIDDI
jgi:initiation factor 1A